MHHNRLEFFFDHCIWDASRFNTLDDVKILKAKWVFTCLVFFLDVGKYSGSLFVEMDSVPIKYFLEVAVSFFLSKVDKLVHDLESLWLFLSIKHCLSKRVEVSAPPIEVEVIILFEEVGDLLEDLDKILVPALPHAASDNMPCLDRSVVDDELVLALVLSLSSNLDGPFDERECVVDLLKVTVALQFPLSDLSFLDA